MGLAFFPKHREWELSTHFWKLIPYSQGGNHSVKPTFECTDELDYQNFKHTFTLQNFVFLWLSNGVKKDCHLNLWKSSVCGKDNKFWQGCGHGERETVCYYHLCKLKDIMENRIGVPAKNTILPCDQKILLLDIYWKL